MDELPESLKDEIDAVDSLDARALRRRYAPLVADLPNCALCCVAFCARPWPTGCRSGTTD